MGADPASDPESAFEQAKKYGEDLARLYAIEKARRVKLQISNQKLQAIFQATPDGLAVLDDALNVEEANPAFWALIERDAPSGKVSLQSILPQPALLAALQAPPPPERSHHTIEISLPLTETITRTLQFDAAPLAAGDQRGWLLLVHDLTERKRLEAMKNEFINIAAHELRTPLASILGFSHVLKETLAERGDELTNHLLGTILEAGDRLKGIVDELIEFASVREQSNSGQSTTFNLVSLIQETLQLITHRAIKHTLTIETHFSQPEIPVTANHSILREVLNRLLENAVTFNEPGGKIIVRAEARNDHVVVEVEDTGIGIPQKEQEKIFDKFYQVEEHLTRSVGGLGLGLAIARRGVELHGGTLTVASQLNKGSRFTITLPKTYHPSTPMENEKNLREAYQQSIAYGRDLARAIAAERKATLRLQTLEAMRQEILAALERGASLEEIESIVKKESG